MTDIPLRSDLDSWKALNQHARHVKTSSLNDLFKDNPERFDRFSLRHEGMLLDYSKQHITQETIDMLCILAQECALEAWRDKLFNGEKINITENRAALHTALRMKDRPPLIVDDKNISAQIEDTLLRMKTFTDKIRKEKRFTDIINIGVGGSDLGAAMAYEALKPYCDRDFNVHFVSNMDATHLAETTRLCDAEKTLIIVSSKTFTTQETMANAKSAQEWLCESLGHNGVSDHLIAATQNIEEAKAFGIHEDNIFPIWDWVGGRFSLWSAIGLPVCIALGFDHFRALLDGAQSMDEHFKNAPLNQNMPIILGLLGIWNRNFLNHESIGIIPYDQYLARFPAYMQQLDMESNGKSVDRQNRKLPYNTGPVVIGEVGSNAQHAFFQLIHQSSTIIPCDFILCAKSQNPLGDHHRKLLASAVAQSKAMMEGKMTNNPHTSFEGNRPSNTILLDVLDPYHLGMLLALYEHKIFVQGIIWNINSFDQCGVELGKILAKDILPQFDEDQNHTDRPTENLIREIRMRN